MDANGLRKKVRVIIGTLAVVSALVIGSSEKMPPKKLLQGNLYQLTTKLAFVDKLQNQLRHEKDKKAKEAIKQELLTLQRDLHGVINEAEGNLAEFNKDGLLSRAGEQQRRRLNSDFYEFVRQWRENQQETTDLVIK